MKKLLFVVNVDWFFISHRLCIAKEAVKKGWEVYVAGEETGRAAEIYEHGITFINTPFSRSGTNPLMEFKTLLVFYKLYKSINPDVVHHITLKPVIYGSIVSRLAGVHGTLNAISGLGYNFTDERKGVVQKFMIRLMKYGFNQNNLTVIFQNQDDFKEINNLGILTNKNKIVFIKGSGVNLELYNHSPFPVTDKVKVLLPTRMLWDKGIGELRKATELLKDKFYGKVNFILSGMADLENKAGVTEDYLKDWEDDDYVKWIGYQKNMVDVYKNSHIVVLPSYREGMPKALIEACAIGRPIITTNAPGCKECVEEGKNGFKVPVKSVKELAKAIETLVLSEKARIKMGKYSREKAENEFSMERVVKNHLEIYDELYE